MAEKDVVNLLYAAVLVFAAQEQSETSVAGSTCAEALEPSRHATTVLGVSAYATALNVQVGKVEVVSKAEAELIVADTVAFCAGNDQMIYARAINAVYNKRYLDRR